ncbi:hypothetical protein [Dyella nitratireducens]|uniref:DUF2845 domain-containing protein n=1 Tax=Dyella nitratireducens TaxID=1849580 RepID=A0ABQ1GU72_9GAMM|nr:hypothetical protein [Dyella nitratireducens]GGA50464.1 hypothetical protein GCM10010981_44770 [Dyella nitratireducens]GLQ42592.1 hypothetical protein GCM10007902_24420 [Dyella nitratireducens]
MRCYLFLALLITSFSAHALQSIRVGSQVLVVGDSAARVKGLLGEPSVHSKASNPGKSKKGKTKAKSSGHSEGKSASVKDKGEKWQYQREGRITTFTIVGGKIAHIEDVAR